MSANPLQIIELRIRQLYEQRPKIEEQLAQIDREITALQEARKPLIPLYAETSPGPIPLGPIPSIEDFIRSEDVGITDAVRGAYRLNPDRKLAAAQVHQIITDHGFNVGKYANAMAVIHQIISRLKTSGELDGPFQQGNERAFQWSVKLTPPPGYVPPEKWEPKYSGPLTGPERPEKKK